MGKEQKKTKRKGFKPQRAITNAYYATIYKGRRMVRKYYSGEKLIGTIEN